MTQSDVRTAWRQFALQCAAHRLRKFGFESHINHYNPEDLRALAQMMPPAAAMALMSEADKKESGAA